MSVSSSRAVSISTGTGRSAWTRRQTSSPSKPGSITSRTTQVGLPAPRPPPPPPGRRRRSRPRSPRPAAGRATASAMVGSSSTTSTRRCAPGVVVASRCAVVICSIARPCVVLNPRPRRGRRSAAPGMTGNVRSCERLGYAAVSGVDAPTSGTPRATGDLFTVRTRVNPACRAEPSSNSAEGCADHTASTPPGCQPLRAGGEPAGRVETVVVLGDRPVGAVVDVQAQRVVARAVSVPVRRYATRSAWTIRPAGRPARRRRTAPAGPSRCQSITAGSRSTTVIRPQPRLGRRLDQREADAQAADQQRGRAGGGRAAAAPSIGRVRRSAARAASARRSERPSEVSIRKQPLAMISKCSPRRAAPPPRRGRRGGPGRTGRRPRSGVGGLGSRGKRGSPRWHGIRLRRGRRGCGAGGPTVRRPTASGDRSQGEGTGLIEERSWNTTHLVH